MSQSYRKQIFADLDKVLDKYPNAKVSDVIFALESTAKCLWRGLPISTPNKIGANKQKIVERTKRYRLA